MRRSKRKRQTLDDFAPEFRDLLSRDPATAYALDVCSGAIPSGELQRLACERHLRDLTNFAVVRHSDQGAIYSRELAQLDDAGEITREGARYYYDPDYVRAKLPFFSFFKHWRGPLAGTPFVPMPWQDFCSSSLLGWFDTRNFYRYQTAYISVPKKSGKSIWVGLFAMLRGFYDGEPGADIYSIATTRDQANIVWKEAFECARRSEHASVKRLRMFEGKREIKDPHSRSSFQPLSSDKDSGDGKNPAVLVADEVHRYKGADLLNMLQESMATRDDPITIEITTAGWNRASMCYEHDRYSQSILRRTLANESWFAFICRADEADKDRWQDPEVWRKANPSYEHAISRARIQQAADDASALPSKQTDFLRYRLNLWTESAERFIHLDRWRDSARDCPLTPEQLRGQECFAGLDLASNQDLNALAIICPNIDRNVYVRMHYWCPSVGIERRVKDDHVPYDVWRDRGLLRATEGDTADHTQIKSDIVEILSVYRLMQLAYDPHNAGNLPSQLADELEQVSYEDQARDPDSAIVIKMYQGFAHLANATKELERLYMDALLKHFNCPILNWMAGNVTTKENEYNQLKPDRQKSSEKIDGIVALVMALACWLLHRAKDEEGSVYDDEERGIIIIGREEN